MCEFLNKMKNINQFLNTLYETYAYLSPYQEYEFQKTSYFMHTNQHRKNYVKYGTPLTQELQRHLPTLKFDTFRMCLFCLPLLLL